MDCTWVGRLLCTPGVQVYSPLYKVVRGSSRPVVVMPSTESGEGPQSLKHVSDIDIELQTTWPCLTPSSLYCNAPSSSHALLLYWGPTGVLPVRGIYVERFVAEGSQVPCPGGLIEVICIKWWLTVWAYQNAPLILQNGFKLFWIYQIMASVILKSSTKMK